MEQKRYHASSASSGGIGFIGGLQLVFIALKLLDKIDWSWWWVLSPLWIIWGVVFGALGLIALYFLGRYMIGRFIKPYRAKKVPEL